MLFVVAALAVAVLGPQPGAANCGTCLLGYLVACQTCVLTDALTKLSRLVALVLGVWAVIDFAQMGIGMFSQPVYLQAFMLGNGGYGALGGYKPFALFTLNLSEVSVISVGREKYKEPFRHWGLVIAFGSSVLTAITMCVPIMIVGCIVALIVQKVRRER